ncbi:Xyloglucan endotransglucosylase/hydrolase protein A [Senna tora]|uniref:Xyloglucan endotransglucosylase/hydrolase protein A n=1 Tax=Senna tora TaxID=362788 RepID=A0A834WVE2_9FABA|nr:Xyloglucan endotransglucosylase/hydrolase protein A [Senna tora]
MSSSLHRTPIQRILLVRSLQHVHKDGSWDSGSPGTVTAFYARVIENRGSTSGLTLPRNTTDNSMEPISDCVLFSKQRRTQFGGEQRREASLIM